MMNDECKMADTLTNVAPPIHRSSFIIYHFCLPLLLALAFVASLAAVARAQPPTVRLGEAVPRDVREIYDRGLAYLVSSQNESGDWKGGGEQGPGVTGMALMVFLASGEDPNFGLYSNNVRRALRSIISQQNAGTGYLGHSMYHHGFATLALAEAYGTVDDRNLDRKSVV
jgi:hypothetical protein